MNVAVVHESLTRLGGAERVLREMHAVFPEAPVYTLVHDDAFVRAFLPGADVRPSFLRHLPAVVRRRERLLLPVLPVAPETFDMSEFDMVLSSASAFAKGIVTRPGTLHVCYCHSPTRYLWDWHARVFAEHRLRGARRVALALLFHYLRMWDHAAARRVDRFLANSRWTKDRIRKYYGRDADVIPPPVDVARFRATKEHAGYFLVVSRLVPYKRVDLVVNAFNKLELPLVIAGEGSERRRLGKLAGPRITFRGFVPDADLPDLYAGARAVIFPGEDDFGIVPVEASASGKPVIAFRRGGALETVIAGITGEFFDEPHEAFLAESVRVFLEREERYRPDVIRKHAERFSSARFRRDLRLFLGRAWEEWRREKRGAAPRAPSPAYAQAARPLSDGQERTTSDVHVGR